MADAGQSIEDQLIDDILACSPGHEPGTRPIHAPGIAVTGFFQASHVAGHYTVAEHFGGQRVCVTVRFSNGTGEPNEPDSRRTLVRGMAVKFHLGEGPDARDTDMIAMNLPMFFVRTVEEFQDLTRSAVPRPARATPWWRKLGLMLALRDGPPDPEKGETTSNGAAIFDFGRRCPFAGPALLTQDMLDAPVGYGTSSYDAVHAFVLTDGYGNTRFVRFRWEPVDGVQNIPDTGRFDYLQTELAESLDRGAIEFVLRMQVAEQGDDASDPTKPWPQRRQRIVMGHLLLKALAPDQRESAELIDFNPTRLVDGIAVSDDATLRIRGPVYRRSAERRRAVAGG
ncbi:MAG: catalase [Actinomycetota bacterium]|nr:catalase [Actinomycetota bacterium]